MTDLFEAAARPFTLAAEQIRQSFDGSDPVARAHINAAMIAAFGGSDADGRWTQRDSFEALEHALALHLRAAPISLLHTADIQPAIDLANRLPTQTVRSEEQIEWQQFSTPIDIAALAVLLGNVQPEDHILEPSAGNGLLVAHCGPHASLHLNEIDERRRYRLAAAFPEAVITGHDGAALNSTLSHLPRPTLVLMNPPFARSLGRGADDFAAVRHLQAALRRLEQGGRLVAIMPDWFGPTARMGLSRGGALLVEETPDGIILRTVEQSIARARALASKYTANKAEASVDAFLANRRAESGGWTRDGLQNCLRVDERCIRRSRLCRAGV
ncbi:SAM-dependent methyltransferase [Sphingobium chungbukense]|uniref:Methylase n=1 Tax=Sphingobium chungbukense TaxID=56193 RepID=A0A0M3AI36_9SPHN|nr:hypothetical protein YP76_24075 [Sphingobium chungbukense]